MVAVIAGILAVRAPRPGAPPPELRVEITTPTTTDPVSLAISADGTKVAFVASDEGRSRLWLRELDAPVAQPLPGTDGASFPFWSPDSRSLGFFAQAKLKRIDIAAGSVQTLADATAGRGGAWTDDGTILFAPQAGPIFRIAATGGERAPLTAVDAPPPGSHRFPQLLPDGRHFLYYTTGTAPTRGVYVGFLDGSTGRRLVDADAAAVYVPSGWLLFVRERTLLAQAFDPVRLEVSGEPVPLASDIAVDAGRGVAALSASVSGPIVYRTGLAGGRRQLTWFDRSGAETGRVGPADEPSTWGPALSPDGRVAAVTRTVDGNQDVWLLDLQRGGLSRFTSGEAVELNPVWSPDGRHIAYTSGSGVYRKPATGADAVEVLFVSPLAKQLSDWSRDGRVLLFRTQDAATRYDIWALSLDGGVKPFPVVQTRFDERDGQLSPDGRWIAYESDESGRFEIYIQPFPGPGRKWPISVDGGAQVRWRQDGQELFYIGLDERLMTVLIQLDADRQVVEAGAPVPLFKTEVGGAVGVWRQQYVPSADGRAFLMNTVIAEETSPIAILLNWR
jgi:Tol biopolymer transport system component